MDIELARTFLAIVEAGSFVRAAERLNVTQTTVSARVRSLEDQLRRPVFIRNKSGATLTPAGEQFLRFAPTLVQVWERARQQLAVPPGRTAMVAVGAELSLWNPLLLNWMLWMRREASDLALRTEVDLPESLLRQVGDGVLDVAVLYAPRHWPGLKVELIMEERLVLASSNPRGSDVSDPDYVYVDWGEDFASHHGMSFPQFSNPGLFVGLGPLALDYVAEVGGAGYFRRRAVQPYLESGRLQLVRDAPEFTYPVYAVYADASDSEALRTALTGLRETAQAQGPLDTRPAPGPQAAAARGAPAFAEDMAREAERAGSARADAEAPQ
ncbi:MAG TPA: LysR family transcriptional regulator [Beijerinckiaceae bacterium]|jgi:DNA-binding transcriptional LysR family regulator